MPDSKFYSVLPCDDFDKLTPLLYEHKDASQNIISAKGHLIHLKNHLNELKVLTVVVEKNYLDHDYLDDFSAYYVKCFHEYERCCKRLHFFEKQFTQNKFDELLQNGHGKEEALFATELMDSYSGFVVVRPLPNTIFGRTCLKPYPPENRRKFCVKFTNKVNLFGIGLKVETLPFQEQDNVTAACATSALWSALHATSEMFHHKQLSPVEITRAATIRKPLGERVFPNDGLTIEQMGCAVSDVGLDPYLVRIDQNDTLKAERILKSNIYAYVTAGIPAVLHVLLTGLPLHYLICPKCNYKNNLNELACTKCTLPLDKVQGQRELIGHHAVTVTGYCLPEDSSQCFKEEHSLHLVSEKITKLYVHDDQVGPDARMKFIEESSSPMGWHLDTSFSDPNYTDIHAEPATIIFPLHNKIRLPFETPYTIIPQFDFALEALKERYEKNLLPDKFNNREWAIHLATLRDLREGIFRKDPKYSGLEKALLTQPLPRFLWHAYAKIDNNPLIDILFDATDIDSGRFILYFKVHDRKLSDLLELEDKACKAFSKPLSMQIKKWLNQVHDRKTKDYAKAPEKAEA